MVDVNVEVVSEGITMVSETPESYFNVETVEPSIVVDLGPQVLGDNLNQDNVDARTVNDVTIKTSLSSLELIFLNTLMVAMETNSRTEPITKQVVETACEFFTNTMNRHVHGPLPSDITYVPNADVRNSSVPYNQCTEPYLYANMLNDNSANLKVNFYALEYNVPDEADFDVRIPMVKVKEVNNQMRNSLYGYFIDKGLTLLDVELYIRNAWKNYGI
ncbi:hypothetical protein Tco_0567952 [Tanacetum coccineum]